MVNINSLIITELNRNDVSDFVKKHKNKLKIAGLIGASVLMGAGTGLAGGVAKNINKRKHPITHKILSHIYHKGHLYSGAASGTIGTLTGVY